MRCDQIEISIVIPIKKHRAESGEIDGRMSQTSGTGDILEVTLTLILIESVRFTDQVRHDQILQPISIDISVGDPHSRLSLTKDVDGQTHLHRSIMKPPRAIAEPGLVRLSIIGHVEIQHTIAIEIASNHAQSSRWPIQSGLDGDRDK